MVDGSPPPRLVLHRRVETHENRARHTMPLLKILLAIHRGLPADPKVVTHDWVRSKIKFAAAIGPAARQRATHRPLAHAPMLQGPPRRQGGSGPEYQRQVEVRIKMHVVKKVVVHTAAARCWSAGDTRPGVDHSTCWWDRWISQRRGEGPAQWRRQQWWGGGQAPSMDAAQFWSAGNGRPG